MRAVVRAAAGLWSGPGCSGSFRWVGMRGVMDQARSPKQASLQSAKGVLHHLMHLLRAIIFDPHPLVSEQQLAAPEGQAHGRVDVGGQGCSIPSVGDATSRVGHCRSKIRTGKQPQCLMLGCVLNADLFSQVAAPIHAKTHVAGPPRQPTPALPMDRAPPEILRIMLEAATKISPAVLTATFWGYARAAPASCTQGRRHEVSGAGSWKTVQSL